jgi:hypothetical protein
MATEGAPAAPEKMTMVVGVDKSDHSYYALQWALQHFFPPGQPHQYRLVVVTAKPTAASAVGITGPGTCTRFCLSPVSFEVRRRVEPDAHRWRPLEPASGAADVLPVVEADLVEYSSYPYIFVVKRTCQKKIFVVFNFFINFDYLFY